MNAYRLPRFGLDQLTLAAAPTFAPGPGDVLVRWHAWSLNYRDLVLVEGSYLPNLPLPFTPGSDAAGEVVAVGDGVTEWRPGDRVISHYLTDWQDGPPAPGRLGASLGGPLPGVFAEESVVPGRALVPLPAGLDFAAGATLPIAALTAWHALFEYAALAPGRTVLFEGTGGVSLFGLQLAHAAGLRTIVTSGSDAKLERVRAVGADLTINYRHTPAWGAEAQRLTGGAGVDLILDVGGGDTLPEALRAVAPGGRIAVIGFLAGKTASLDVGAWVRSLVTIHGLRVGSRAMFRSLLAALTQHAIQPVIDRRFAFTELPAALRHLGNGAHFGKIVLQRDA